jgi:hypothetical protein
MNDQKRPIEGGPAESESRFEKYATSQAAGDGIEGDASKKHKTEDEKLGSQMPDRK